MAHTNPQLTIGILAERGSAVFEWDRTRAVLTDPSNAHRVKLVWFRECPSNSPRRRLASIPARLAWRALAFVETRGLPDAYGRYDPVDAIDLPCRFAGHYKDFDANALAKVQASNVDLLIRLGGRGIYRDGVLDAAPMGLISIHHGDDRTYRGGPPGFWEVVNGEDRCGFIVQKLTRTLDAGDVLRRGTIINCGNATANRAALFAAADEALAETMMFVLDRGRLPDGELSNSEPGPIYRMPALRELASYISGRRKRSSRPAGDT